MTDTSARDAIAALQGHEAWAIIRRSTRAGDRDTVGMIGGRRSEVASVLDVPLETGVPETGRTVDRLLAVPFRQVRERGFEAHDDGTPLVAVEIESEQEFSVAEVIEAIDDTGVEFADRGGFDIDDEEYGKLVATIISDEIGQGEGANLVVGRHYRATVADWGADKALTVFKRLLERERGAYWTYVFFTGDRYLIGASPERHVSIHGGDVRMNPISGTFRIPREGPDAADVKGRLLDFLRDEKEIYELFMVVDEELKMMCDICHEGGQVLGPFLKPMSHLVHTEYLLAGRTDRDPREVLRDTMYAATVTGSPVENACRLIKQYETEGRGYYGAALAILGRDDAGEPVLDSPIVIRTADVSLDGRLTVTAGATLVRDSDPAYEVAETHAKAGGILSAFGLVPAAPAPAVDIAELVNDEDVLLSLNARNRRLSTFWLTDQGDATPDPRLAGRSVVILDGEDDFVNMLRHVLGVFGMTSEVVRHEDWDEYVRLGSLAMVDLVVVGPGPGDPRDDADPKMAKLRAAVAALLESERPFLAVCLGHQALCHTLGIPLFYKDIVFQGTQSPVTVDGRTERVGFYNTFVGRAGSEDALPDGVRVDTDPESGDIHHLVGPHYRGIQFHAESILSQHGYDVLHHLVSALLLDPVTAPDVVVVDHHDSYTWNLVHLVASVTGELPTVVQHDEVSPEEVLRHSHVVLSPGPGHPAIAADFSVGRDVLLAGTRPVLGVCLGMQGLVTAYGGTVDRVQPAHGVVARINHDGLGVFAGLPQLFAAVRYHSLAAVDLPASLVVTASDAGGDVVMGVRHVDLPLEGVQFHPESILSEHGAAMLRNFLGRSFLS